MHPLEAKAFILAQLEPDRGVGEPQTFLGALRPYRHILPRQQFHGIMRALRVLVPTLSGGPLVDRELVSALWSLCELTRLCCVDEDTALRRDRLISAEDLALLRRWHNMVCYAVMIILETGDDAEAFHEYDRYCAEDPPP